MTTLAERLSKSRVLRHLFFLGAALCNIAVMGYHFGTFDQVIHIPFLKKYADASLYPGDPLLNLPFQHYSYFWFFFQPLFKFGVLEEAMFASHVLATYLTFWALWTLSLSLFRKPLAALYCVIAFIPPHLGFGGIPMFEFSLLNRNFVLPFLLGAIVLFLQQRYLPALALLGLMYNLHVISVNFVLAMFLFDCAVEFRRIGWRTVVLGIVVFAIGASPVLAWKITSSPIDLTLRPEWLSIIARGMLYDLFYLAAPYPPVVLSTLSLAGAFVLFFVIAGRCRPSPPHDRTVTHFMAAALIILLAQIVAVYWLPITIILQLQIARVGQLVLILGYLYFAYYLAEFHRWNPPSRFDLGLLAGAYVLSPFPIIPMGILAVQRLIAGAAWRRALACGIVLFAALSSAALLLRYDIWYPGIYIFARKTPWYDVQVWARENTSKDSMFIAPPQIWGFYEPEWRVFSERATVASLSDLLEVVFVPEYLEVWQPRFEALAPGALARFRGNFFENIALVAQAFYSLPPDDLLRIARQYDADYLVVEKPHRRPWPIVYENERFAVYDLREAKAAAGEKPRPVFSPVRAS